MNKTPPYSVHVRCWLCKHWHPGRSSEWVERYGREEKYGLCDLFTSVKKKDFFTSALQHCPAGEIEDKSKREIKDYIKDTEPKNTQS